MKRARIAEIAELIDKRGKITLKNLGEHFPNVSQMTLRRDLFLLEEEGKVIRVRGGAMSVRDVQKTSGEPYTKKTTIHTDEKIELAQKAVVPASRKMEAPSSMSPAAFCAISIFSSVWMVVFFV